MTMKSSLTLAIFEWLQSIDGEDPITNFSQKTLREWLQSNPNHKKIAILRHPLVRVWDTFCTNIILPSKDAFPRFRNKLNRDYGAQLPETQAELAALGVDDVRAKFKCFLSFLKSNLRGQTPLRVDESCASQSGILAGYSQTILPDEILKEDDIATRLPALAKSLGAKGTIEYSGLPQIGPFPLSQIVDDEIHSEIATMYNRDYEQFGFSDWRP